MDNGYRHYAGVVGSKTLYVGKDESCYNYTCIQSAIDAAQNWDTIYIEPGTWTLTEQLVIAKPLQLVGMCGSSKVILTSASDLGTSLVDLNVPAAYAAGATIENVFENIYFLGCDTDQDVIDIDNDGGCNLKFKIKFTNCTIELASAAATGMGVDCDHTYAAKEIQIKFSGSGWEKIQAVDFVAAHASDGIEWFDVRVTKSNTRKGFNSDGGVVAAIFLFQNCRFDLAQGTSGGNAAQQVASVGSWSFNGGATYLAAATGEFTGSHTETIVA